MKMNYNTTKRASRISSLSIITERYYYRIEWRSSEMKSSLVFEIESNGVVLLCSSISISINININISNSNNGYNGEGNSSDSNNGSYVAATPTATAKTGTEATVTAAQHNSNLCTSLSNTSKIDPSSSAAAVTVSFR